LCIVQNRVAFLDKELITVLEEWIILKLRDKDPIPEVDGLKIEIKELAVA